ncbi:MAG: hypothetical protein WD066_05855 [Planctomycetaceae bacterium]
MSGELLHEVRAVVADFESAQAELQRLYGRKRTALVEARAAELIELAQAEAALAERCRGIFARRARVLSRAATQGICGDTLAAVTGQVAGPEARELGDRIETSRRRSELLRREHWALWIIAQRASRHHVELIELVAEHGRRSPVYEQDRAARHVAGGAILDASA